MPSGGLNILLLTIAAAGMVIWKRTFHFLGSFERQLVLLRHREASL
jgi:hypothetical protein